jgi:N utilization substance protein A
MVQSDAEYGELAEAESERMAQVENILGKKAEGRPIPPEEYQVLTAFVDTVQGERQARMEARRQTEREALEAVRSEIPETAYDTSLEAAGVSTRVVNLMTEAGYSSAGQVMERLALNEDALLEISGMGPKSIEELNQVLDGFEFPEPAPPVEEVVEAEGEGLVGAEAAVEVEADAAEAEAMPAEAVVAAETDEVEGEPETIEKAFDAIAEEIESEIDIEAITDFDEEEEEGDGDQDELEKKKQKQRKRVVEYDPELDEMIVRRRRKPGRAEGEWDKYGGDF